MTTFQERIREALSHISARRDVRDARDTRLFDRVLSEFAETLCAASPWVGAALEMGMQASTRRLVTWPRIRRDERTMMLMFVWENGRLHVLGEPEREPFPTPEALRDYLIEFLGSGAFGEMWSDYGRRCEEDVGAFLRVSGFMVGSPGDVYVVVPAGEQLKLAGGEAGGMLEIAVRPEALPGTGAYDTGGRYICLSSGGYGLRVEEHGLAEGGRIVLRGAAMGADETV